MVKKNKKPKIKDISVKSVKRKDNVAENAKKPVREGEATDKGEDRVEEKTSTEMMESKECWPRKEEGEVEMEEEYDEEVRKTIREIEEREKKESSEEEEEDAESEISPQEMVLRRVRERET